MKKLIYAEMLLAIVMVSCSKETITYEPIPDKPGFHLVTIIADADSPTVKTTYAADRNFSWVEGDQISVLYHNSSNEPVWVTFTAQSTSSQSAFTAEVDDDLTMGSASGKYWALYPANVNHVYTDDSTIGFAQPDLVDGTTAKIAMISYNTSQAFHFRQMGGALKFTINNIREEVTRIRLQFNPGGSTSKYLSGVFTVVNPTSSTPEINHTTITSDGSHVINVTGTVSSKSAVVYMPLPILEAWPYYTFVVYDDNSGLELCRKRVGEGGGAIVTSRQQIKTVSTLTTDFDRGSAPIQIDGYFSYDWAKIDMYPLDDSKDAFPGDGARIVEWKAASDATNVYFYYKVTASEVEEAGMWDTYIVTGFDTDNNSETSPSSASYNLGGGFEYRSIAFPFKNDAKTPVTFYNAGDTPCGDSEIKAYDFTSSSVGKVSTAGSLVSSYAYVETVIPRSMIGSPASNKTIRVRNSCGYTPSAAQTITLAATE